jgi:hypothetical protein
LLITVLLLPALACNLGKEEPLWTPETPKQYTAETMPVEVYVLIDKAGNVVDFESPYAYGVTAKLRYVLRFWDVGGRGAAGYEAATIHKAYTPIRVTGIHNESEYTPEEQAAIYARTSFPTTEVKWADLIFSGGPQGNFGGDNPDTGGDIFGYMDWREKEWEMHVCFYYDVDKSGCLQDYLVQGEEPFYNWP